MSLLLDTHVYLWWLSNHPRLRARSLEEVRAASAVYVSAASLWEIGIKVGLRRLQVDLDLACDVTRQGFRHLPVTWEDGRAVAELPRLHGDPFDRILIAQARRLGLTLATHDGSMREYPVQLLVV